LQILVQIPLWPNENVISTYAKHKIF